VKAVVIYESFWGSTAAVARAIASGLGEGTLALPTGDATPEALAGADLVVAGSPVIGFHMPTDKMREAIRANPGPAPTPPDLSQPSMASWLQGLAAGRGAVAAFDTRIRGPFGSAAPAILKGLEAAGYRGIAKPRGFTVTGKYGPLREGELERAREWGAELARALG
jgi:flavodoxin